MKRRFFALGGLSLATVLIVGCIQPKTLHSEGVPLKEVADHPNQAQKPTNETAQGSSGVRSGTFVDGEHPTKGTVQILEKDGKQVLELDESFKTSSSGPDLVVILHRLPDVIGSTKPPAYPIKEGDYVIIAPLKEYSGAQSYEIPDNIKLEDFPSAAIWCRKFNATFGAARLQ